jgi:hypothetical protein
MPHDIKPVICAKQTSAPWNDPATWQWPTRLLRGKITVFYGPNYRVPTNRTELARGNWTTNDDFRDETEPWRAQSSTRSRFKKPDGLRVAIYFCLRSVGDDELGVCMAKVHSSYQGKPAEIQFRQHL